MNKTPVTSSILEERVAMYLQAIEDANDPDHRQQLEKSIQMLMDLMEKVNVGQVVTADKVPPALIIRSQSQSHPYMPPQSHLSLQSQPYGGMPSAKVAKMLGELSGRLENYHKALYYADIELEENRNPEQIHTLQRGLQIIQALQEKALAGISIKAKEIPPPVTLPSDDEFVKDPKTLIPQRMAEFYQSVENIKASNKKAPFSKDRRLDTLERDMKKLEYLFKRADSNIPIYRKDVPEPPPLGDEISNLKKAESYKATVSFLTKIINGLEKAARLAGSKGLKDKESEFQQKAKKITQLLRDFETKGKPVDIASFPNFLADIEGFVGQQEAEVKLTARQQEPVLELLRKRLQQYQTAALTASRAGNKQQALVHVKTVKGLKAFISAAEKGGEDSIDATKIPPEPPSLLPSTEGGDKEPTKPPGNKTEGDKLEQEGETPEHNLADELSSFLSGSSESTDDSSSQTESISSTDSPAKSTSLLSQTRSPSRFPSTSSSGFNPLYAVTHGAPPQGQVSPNASPQHVGRNSSQGSPSPQSSPRSVARTTAVSRPPPPGMIPNRSLKPLMSFENSTSQQLQPEQHLQQQQQQQHQQSQQYQQQQYQNQQNQPQQHYHQQQQQHPQSPSRTLNGYHGNSGGLPPGRQNQGLFQQQQQQHHLKNGSAAGAGGEVTCIEILKYERLQLEKEGTEHARTHAQQLALQMEEEKQRLRIGGYEAWLAYLGQVEEDVTNINCDMKLAREGGQEEQLASLIIKKELAERELAVMRKRLPELQIL